VRRDSCLLSIVKAACCWATGCRAKARPRVKARKDVGILRIGWRETRLLGLTVKIFDESLEPKSRFRRSESTFEKLVAKSEAPARTSVRYVSSFAGVSRISMMALTFDPYFRKRFTPRWISRPEMVLVWNCQWVIINRVDHPAYSNPRSSSKDQTSIMCLVAPSCFSHSFQQWEAVCTMCFRMLKGGARFELLSRWWIGKSPCVNWNVRGASWIGLIHMYAAIVEEDKFEGVDLECDRYPLLE